MVAMALTVSLSSSKTVAMPTPRSARLVAALAIHHLLAYKTVLTRPF